MSMFRPSRRRADTTPDLSSHLSVKTGLIGTDDSGKTEVLTTLLNHRIQTDQPQDYVLPADDEMIAQSTQLFDIPCEPEEKLLKWCEWSECFILCFSVSVRSSYDEIIRLRESIRKVKRSKAPPTILLGTSFDVKSRVVEYDEASKLAKQLNFQYTEVSRNAFHISEAIRIIVKLALQYRTAGGAESAGTVRRGVRTVNMDAKKQNKTLKRTEVSSFEKWDETLDQIAKRVTQNPQQFENKAEVLRKFLEGEREYGEKLTLALKIFYRPLVTANPPILKRKNMQKIFRNIEVIVEQTVNFVNALYKRVFEEWKLGNESVGDIFEMLGTLIHLNETYLQNHISSVTCVNNMEKKNVEFADFLQRTNACNEALGRKLDFIGFLLLPVERLRKYERVVEAMQTHTPENQPDFAVLSSVAVAISAAKNIIQTKKEENFQIVFSIQRSFVGDFVIAKEHSYFITDGPLMKVCKSGERKLRWFFLFNDSLVYATVIAAPTLPSMPAHHPSDYAKNISSLSLQPYKGNVYAISRKITLGIACKIVDMSNGAGFKIISVEKTFVVFAANLTEKRRWLEQFLTVLSDDAIVDDGRSESTYQLSPAAHASVKMRQCMMCSKIIHEAKHNCCRNCGKVICATCSTKRYRVSHFGDDSTVRVCDYCHQYLSISMDDEESAKPPRTASQAKLGEPESAKFDGFAKTASLVGYSLKKMKNVGQLVIKKAQVFKRKKSTNNVVAQPVSERPQNVTIGNPIVNNNVVVMSNPIINQYNHALQSSPPSSSSSIAALSSSPTSIFIPPPSASSSKPPSAFAAAVAPNHGVFIHNSGTLRGKKDVRNSITQEEAVHLEQNLKQKIHKINLAIQKQQRENPRPVPPPRGPLHTQQPATTTTAPSNPPIVAPTSSPPKHLPSARRYGVKFENSPSAAQLETSNVSVQKTRPEVPSKPLPARPSITHTNINQINLWKCLPDEPSAAPLSPTNKNTESTPPFSTNPQPPSVPSSSYPPHSSIKPKPPSNPPPKPPTSKPSANPITNQSNPPTNPASNLSTSPPGNPSINPLAKANAKTTSNSTSKLSANPPLHKPPTTPLPAKPAAASNPITVPTNPSSRPTATSSTNARPRVPARTMRADTVYALRAADTEADIPEPSAGPVAAGRPARPSREAPARPVRPPRDPNTVAAHMTYPRNRHASKATEELEI